MGRRTGQIEGKREQNDTKDIKGYKSFREGKANGMQYCRDQINKEWKHPFHMALWRYMNEK